MDDLIQRRVTLLANAVQHIFDQRKQTTNNAPKYRPATVMARLKQRAELGEQPPIARTTFDNLVRGNLQSVPSKAALEWFITYMDCSDDEARRLLRIAGYLPGHAPIDPTVPDSARQQLTRQLHNSQYPAFLMDQQWDVLDANLNFCRAMGVSNQFLRDIRPAHRNSLFLVCSRHYPFRARLTATPADWDDIVRINVWMHKVQARDIAHLDWYQQRIEALCAMSPELRQAWREVEIHTPINSPLVTARDRGGAPLAFRVPFNTTGHPIQPATPAVIDLSPASNFFGGPAAPAIFFYAPRDEAGAAWFKAIGIRAPD